MTDRELLELAARAAGLGKTHYENGAWLDTRYGLTEAIWSDSHEGYWNPLESDADALRLAVKLQLTVCNEHLSSGVAYCVRPIPGDGINEDAFPEVQSGTNEGVLIPADYAATRRAIVLAAVEIARARAQ